MPPRTPTSDAWAILALIMAGLAVALTVILCAIMVAALAITLYEWLRHTIFRARP